MIYNIAYDEFVKKINPIVFSKYLSDTGWVKFQSKRRDINIFQKESDRFHQVIVPMDESLSDYNEAILTACQEVSKTEGRQLNQLLLLLLNPN